MRRTLRAEWTKLRTAPGTAWLPLAILLGTVAMSAAVSSLAAPGTTACAGGCDPARLALSGVYLGQIPVVVLAVLAVTGEYQSGLMAVTLTATPSRLAVFAAKAVAVPAAVLPAALLGVAGSVLAGRLLLPSGGFGAPMLRAAAGTVLYLGLVALLSLGVATALRHTAAALTAVLALLYLATFLAPFVTVEPWHTRIERYAPMSAGLAVQATTDLAALPVAPWPGLAVLAAYAAGALAAGGALFLARDA